MRPVCKLLLPRNDISFALLPYSVKGQYAYRLSTFQPREREKGIQCVEEPGFDSVPKLQFHESGRVHISAGSQRGSGIRDSLGIRDRIRDSLTRPTWDFS
jgi:hypothetical protein